MQLVFREIPMLNFPLCIVGSNMEDLCPNLLVSVSQAGCSDYPTLESPEDCKRTASDGWVANIELMVSRAPLKQTSAPPGCHLPFYFQSQEYSYLRVGNVWLVGEDIFNTGG